jgi:actin related protein 2/3 complex subunit 1A/1B
MSALGWVHAVAWSPSGETLAYAGHDSSVHFATFPKGVAPGGGNAEPIVRSVNSSGILKRRTT